MHSLTVRSNQYSSGCNTSPQDKRVSNDKDTQVANVPAQLLLTYCIQRIYFRKIISQHSVVARRQRRIVVSLSSLSKNPDSNAVNWHENCGIVDWQWAERALIPDEFLEDENEVEAYEFMTSLNFL